MATPRTPPGPRGHLLLGSLREIQRDNVQAFMSGFREHGDVVHFRGPLTIDLLVHPDHVKHVLQDRHRAYPRPGKVSACLATIVGTGLVAAEGREWRQSRRVAQPAFARHPVTACARTFTQTTREVLDEVERTSRDGDVLDVKSLMMRISLSNLMRALFHAELADDLRTVEQAVAEALRFTHRRMTSPVDPYRLPLPGRRRFDAALTTLDAVLYRLVQERRGGDGGDLVSTLLRSADPETGVRPSVHAVRDQVSGFFVAGHETVSSALTWTCYLLSRHPEAWRRVRSEVDAVLGGREPSADDLPALEYTRMVIDEAMRLYPPIFVYMRCAAEDDVVGGHAIPRGRWVVLCPYVTHRHPEFWDNPEAFDPERFTAERSAGRPRMAYFPFGGGPRKCIGDGFAMTQMPLVLAMLVQRFRFELVDGLRVRPEPAISFRPEGPLLMRARHVVDAVAA